VEYLEDLRASYSVDDDEGDFAESALVALGAGRDMIPHGQKAEATMHQAVRASAVDGGVARVTNQAAVARAVCVRMKLKNWFVWSNRSSCMLLVVSYTNQ
jgi:hypothetical protein